MQPFNAMRIKNSFLCRFIKIFPLLTSILFVHLDVQAVSVISHSDSTPVQISKQQLKAIYMGQKTQWSNGLSVKIFVLNNRNKTHQKFVQDLLGMYPYQFNRRWQKLAFSGFAVKPTEVNSYQEMLNIVASTPGSIGYVNKKTATQGVSYAALY